MKQLAVKSVGRDRTRNTVILLLSGARKGIARERGKGHLIERGWPRGRNVWTEGVAEVAAGGVVGGFAATGNPVPKGAFSIASSRNYTFERSHYLR